jgi:hypothetical protein
MSRISSIKNPVFCAFSAKTDEKKSFLASFGRVSCSEKVFIRSKRIISGRGSAKIGFMGMFLILASVIVISGALYLYQVNDLAGKSYEVKEIEDEIDNLKKDNEKNKIKEVELKSLYNIEKTTEDLNMVGAKEISYLEINGPVAMK